MIVDRYTKAVLTVIAVCLLWICAMGVAPRVDAQQPPLTSAGAVQPVVIVGTGSMDHAGKVTVNFTQDGGKRTEPTVPIWMPYPPAKPLPVSLAYTPANPLPMQLFPMGARFPVEIAGVKRGHEWEPIRVSVEPAPTLSKPGGR